MASNVVTFALLCFVVFSRSLAQEAGAGDCVCVSLHLCVNGTLVRDGGIGIVERLNIPGEAPPKPPQPCQEEGFVCCPTGQLSETATVKTEEGPGPLSNPSRPTYLGSSTHSPTDQDSSTPEPPLELHDLPEAKPNAVYNPKPGHCGVKRVTLQHRISFISLRESVAQFAEFPWMLAILVETEPQTPFKFQCGASLIHKQVALTAAHCVDRVSRSSLWIRAGEWNTRNTEEPLPHQDRRVSHVELHPHYSHSGLKHDIALLFLDEPFDIKDNVDLICLPNPKTIFHGTQCTATGWGKDAANPTVTSHEILHKVDVPIISCEECQERLRKSVRLGPYFELHPSALCAGGEKDKDSCKGDGGGPLVCPTGIDNVWVQAGIVSWGIGCGTTYPAVYTDVSEHTEWIYKKIFESDKEKKYANSLPADVWYRYFPNLSGVPS